MRLRPALSTAATAVVLVGGVAALALAAPSVPERRVVQVHPGGLRDAIGAARAGDTLVLHAGRYRGAFVVDKALRIVGAEGERRPLIDGRCRTRTTIAVRADGVVLRRLHVVGATEGFGPVPSEVDFSGVGGGRIDGSLLRDTCDAEYGVNVFGSGAVKVLGNEGLGFSDAAFYVGGISSTPNGTLTVARNEGRASNRGLIVEDSAGGRIVIAHNRFHGNRAPGHGPPSGIYLHRSDRVLLDGNHVARNGRLGIHLDAGSDRNRLFDNVFRRNPAGNVRDEGAGNCGTGNRPNPFPPCP